MPEAELIKEQIEKECFYSVIVTVNTGESVNDLLDSIDQDQMANRIQVILALCDIRHADVNDIIEGKYREKVCCCEADSTDLADVFSAVKDKIQGTYVCFVNERMYYTQNTFSYVHGKIQETEQLLVSICPIYEDSMKGSHEYPITPKRSGVINAIKAGNKVQFFFSACFIHHSVLKKIPFDCKIAEEKDKDFLLRYYLKYETHLYLAEKELHYLDGAENEFATNVIQYSKDWYLNDTKAFLLKWVKKAARMEPAQQRLVQTWILYFLYARYNCNSNDRNKKVLEGAELEQFTEDAKQVLQYIPEKIILRRKREYSLPRQLKFLFLRLRCEAMGVTYQLSENGVSFFLNAPEKSSIRKVYEIAKIRSEKIVITAINYEDNVLKIDFKSNLIDFLNAEDISIVVLYGDYEAQIEEVKCYPFIKSFGKTILERKQYRATIPVDDSGLNIKFCLELNGKRYTQSIWYGNAAARLSNTYSKCYWNFQNDLVLFHNGSKKQIRLRKFGKKRLLGREIRLLLEMRRKKKDDDYSAMWKLRMRYHMQKKRYANQRIWISFDKLYKGGDNGEYMYHYLKEHDLGITPYYIINEDAPDYQRLKDAGENILLANSEECRLMCLFAEVILATHTTVWTYCGFTKTQQEYVRDLLRAKIVCIQHGLTVQKIAQYQNRLFDNTRFYCCASKYEVDNILQPIYGYEEKDVTLTGLARYDGLENKDKKQILITPTWRRDLVNNGIACQKKTHNAHFKDSVYYKVYNDLINNKKLIQVAREMGYQIIYLLHPAMSAQSVDYVRNDYVQIIEATGDMSYEQILTESSLMVTDYSGVQFDFAYMRKPVLYYHPDVLPPFYEEGVFRYDTMGFGEICRQEAELIDTLCAYMKNGCRSKEFYIDRADSFFEFDDFQSCQRIYEEIEKFLKRG